MLAYFFNSPAFTPALRSRIAPHIDDEGQLYLFSNKARDAQFPLAAGQIGSAFQPLRRSVFDKAVVDPACDLFASSMSYDWLANIVNSVAPGGEIILPRQDDAQAEARNRLGETDIREFLGEPHSSSDAWLVYRRGGTELACNRSILGGFQQARGEFVLNALFGGATNQAETDRVKAYFSTILAPDAPAPRAHLRLPRAATVDIVKRVRAGELGSGRIAENVRQSEPGPWSFKESAAQVERQLNSWQNYLMQGTYYKAATLCRLIRNLFGPGRPVSFLEHGGYGGTLSMQLLLERSINVEYARCCEVEQFVLPNVLEMVQRVEPSLEGRFHMQITSAEEAVYTRPYDVIMFSHVLLYLRRDMLDMILKAAWDKLNPGGALVVFENTAPPTTPGGNDDDIIFGPEELDGYFERLGPLEYVEARTCAPASREDRATKALFRYVRKPE